MQTTDAVFAIGQRFGQRVPGAPQRMWSITKIETPSTRFAQDRIVLTAEGNGATMIRFAPVLSQELMDGLMRRDGEPDSAPASDTDRPPDIALSEIIAGMSRVQLRKYKTRCAYVSVMLQAEGAGLSWKSETFCSLVQKTFEERHEAWTKAVMANPKKPPEPIESKAPSSYSVDRWFRAVRRNNGDLRILAVEALAIQTRGHRRPEERKLLAAFLATKQARRVKYTAKSLTNEFARLVKKTDPLRMDEAIERLAKEAERIERDNKERSRKHPLKRAKRKQSPEGRSASAAT